MNNEVGEEEAACPDKRLRLQPRFRQPGLVSALSGRPRLRPALDYFAVHYQLFS